MTAKQPWREPPWFAAPAKRISFLRVVTRIDPAARSIRPLYPFRGGFGLQLSIQLPDLPSRRVEIYFSQGSPGVPRVFVDGPDESLHRYQDQSLCMWYPYDPPEARWWPTDGAEILLGQVAAHLIKEEWYRRTGEWPGDEIAHTPVKTRTNRKNDTGSHD
jgi:hypothetical protein